MSEDVPKVDTFAGLSYATHIKPAVESKVDTLSAVETEVKTGVIPARECDHELASVLD